MATVQHRQKSTATAQLLQACQNTQPDNATFLNRNFQDVLHKCLEQMSDT